MKVNLRELLPMQQLVNKTVVERLGRELFVDELVLAFNIELFEFFNEIGTWKWWKQNHTTDRERVLDELADCFAFFLSIVDISEKFDLVEKGTDVSTTEAFEQDLNSVLEKLLQNYEGEDGVIIANGLIGMIGSENEMNDTTNSIARMATAIAIVNYLYEGITWKEISEAYYKKSEKNIERQQNNY